MNELEIRREVFTQAGYSFSQLPADFGAVHPHCGELVSVEVMTHPDRVVPIGHTWCDGCGFQPKSIRFVNGVRPLPTLVGSEIRVQTDGEALVFRPLSFVSGSMSHITWQPTGLAGGSPPDRLDGSIGRDEA